MELAASGVPQRSVLRFGLYNVSKPPEKGVNRKETVFAYDGLLLSTVKSETSYEGKEPYSAIWKGRELQDPYQC